MIEREYYELMNGEIDGVNSSEDSQRLHVFLETNAAARSYYESLERIVRHMEREPAVEVPDGLIEKILAAVPFGRAPGADEERPGFWSWLRGVFAPRPIGYVASFGAGVAASLVAFMAVGTSPNTEPLDAGYYSGTMRTISPTDGFQQIGRLDVKLDNVTGQVRLHESAHLILAEVDLHSAKPIEWVLEYDKEDVAFEGFRQSAPGSQVASAITETRVIHDGDNRYLLFFTHKDDDPAPMRLRIFDADQLVYDHPVDPRAGS